MAYHVFTCRPNRDRAAAARLEAHGLAATVLMERFTQRKGPLRRKVESERPIMPGYVFAAADVPVSPSLVAKLLSSDAEGLKPFCPILSLLYRCDGTPAVLSATEVDEIEAMAMELRARERKRAACPVFHAGQQVRAKHGLMAGYAGIIAAVLGEGYVWEVEGKRVAVDGADLEAVA